MSRYIKILIIFLLILPSVYTWKAETHENIIEYTYLNLPAETREKLNLDKLKEGAVIPDRNFRDFKKHHYPQALEEAKKWLELDNDTDLSLNLGIASHYITDSFSAPHNIKNEKYYDHSYFEEQVRYYYPTVDCINRGLSLNDLQIASKNKDDWNQWLKTKDKKIPQREVEEATVFMFSIILNKLNATCSNNLKTKVIEKPYLSKYKLILISSIVILAVGLYFLKH